MKRRSAGADVSTFRTRDSSRALTTRARIHGQRARASVDVDHGGGFPSALARRTRHEPFASARWAPRQSSPISARVVRKHSRDDVGNAHRIPRVLQQRFALRIHRQRTHVDDVERVQHLHSKIQRREAVDDKVHRHPKRQITRDQRLPIPLHIPRDRLRVFRAQHAHGNDEKRPPYRIINRRVHRHLHRRRHRVRPRRVVRHHAIDPLVPRVRCRPIHRSERDVPSRAPPIPDEPPPRRRRRQLARVRLRALPRVRPRPEPLRDLVRHRVARHPERRVRRELRQARRVRARRRAPPSSPADASSR